MAVSEIPLHMGNFKTFSLNAIVFPVNVNFRYFAHRLVVLNFIFWAQKQHSLVIEKNCI